MNLHEYQAELFNVMPSQFQGYSGGYSGRAVSAAKKLEEINGLLKRRYAGGRGMGA